MPLPRTVDTLSVLEVTEENGIHLCACAVQLGRTGLCQGPGTGHSGKLWQWRAGSVGLVLLTGCTQSISQRLSSFDVIGSIE